MQVTAEIQKKYDHIISSATKVYTSLCQLEAERGKVEVINSSEDLELRGQYERHARSLLLELEEDVKFLLREVAEGARFSLNLDNKDIYVEGYPNHILFPMHKSIRWMRVWLISEGRGISYKVS